MGSRAIVARAVGPNAWKGVWNNWGSQPKDLGNYLIRECKRRGGDLSSLVRDVIDEVPGGWSKLQKNTRAPDYSWPPFHGPGELAEFCDVLDYVYILRPSERCLDVFRIRREGGELELVDSVHFDADGHPDREF